ncbi:hypothetical protein BsWGS_14675 [Bradybaena similaris]
MPLFSMLKRATLLRGSCPVEAPKYNKEGVDRFRPPPSACVHVRGLSDLAAESDLIEAVQHFGAVRDVMLMPRKRQALIEFEDIEGAKSCVEYCQQGNAIYCGGKPAFFNFSMSQKIERSVEMDDSKPPNHILLFTVLNPQYPITVDVMNTINKPYGCVQRIVIFKKNGVQAMVEFDNVDSAKRARQALNGADIYSGCCTLKIEFAKPARLNVVRNDHDSWDYTNPALGGNKLLEPAARGQPLLQEPRIGSAPAPYNGPVGTGFAPGPSGPPAFANPGYYDDGYGRQGPYGNPGERYGARPDRFGGHGGYDGGMGGQGTVLMVYGLNMDKMNCDRLFNLFCLYGNVIRIKFLKSKEGSAMVELGDPLSVERAISNLNNAFMFGNKLQLSLSKQSHLQEVMNPHQLPDGSMSFKDFMGNRNNRFSNPDAAHKNRIQNPSKVLHFFNAPPHLGEKDISELFENHYGKSPVAVKQFPSKTERSSAGLVEFENKTDGIEALVMVNHTAVSTQESKTPFIFKLCFSSMPAAST